MSLTNNEREFIQELFQIGTTTAENIETKLAPQIFDFLKQNGNLNTIIDSVLFKEKNKFRPYEAAIITKYLTPDLDPADMIKELTGGLSGQFLIYIDFHFLFLCPSHEDAEKVDELKFQFASKASAINETHKISSQQDYEDLSKEFDGKTYPDLLNDVFIHHVDLYEYHGSGLRPYELLSLVVHVQKFP